MFNVNVLIIELICHTLTERRETRDERNMSSLCSSSLLFISTRATISTDDNAEQQFQIVFHRLSHRPKNAADRQFAVVHLASLPPSLRQSTRRSDGEEKFGHVDQRRLSAVALRTEAHANGVHQYSALGIGTRVHLEHVFIPFAPHRNRRVFRSDGKAGQGQ